MSAAALIPADAVAIGAGAVLGAISRYQVGRVAAEWIATRSSNNEKMKQLTGWHTAGINIGGSFLLGGISAAPAASAHSSGNHKLAQNPSPLQRFSGLSPRTKLMLGVGFCGSFTTFSTFSVDVATWLSQGQTGKAISYMAANNIGSVLAAAAGMTLVRKLFRL